MDPKWYSLFLDTQPIFFLIYYISYIPKGAENKHILTDLPPCRPAANILPYLIQIFKKWNKVLWISWETESSVALFLMPHIYSTVNPVDIFRVWSRLSATTWSRSPLNLTWVPCGGLLLSSVYSWHNSQTDLVEMEITLVPPVSAQISLGGQVPVTTIACNTYQFPVWPCLLRYL